MVEQSRLNHSEDGGSNPTPPLHFMPLDYATAARLVEEKHYSHSVPSISWAWGIKADNQILGVLTVGKFARSSTTSEGVCGKDRKDDVFELNRVWLDDVLPPHSESRFIGWCLRTLRKERPTTILVSYADTNPVNKRDGYKPHDHQNQVGIIYQATNFIYTGATCPEGKLQMDWSFPSDVDKGRDYRSSKKECRGALVKTCACGNSITKMLKQDSVTCVCGYIWAAGIGGGKRPWVCRVLNCKWHKPCEVAIKIPRSRKHRYVWFANPADRALLKWPVEPYPKALSQENFKEAL